MARVSREKLIELYRDLPPDVAEVYENASTSEVMLDVGHKHSIPIDQLGRLSYEVGLVMVGASPAREFIENIERGLGVPRAKAVEIAREINTRLFSPIRESLKRIHKLGTSEQLIDERESSAIGSVQIPINPVRTDASKPADGSTTTSFGVSSFTDDKSRLSSNGVKPASTPNATPVALKISEVVKQVALDKSGASAPPKAPELTKPTIPTPPLASTAPKIPEPINPHTTNFGVGVKPNLQTPTIAPSMPKTPAPPVMQRAYELRNQTSQSQTPTSPPKLYIPVTKSETPPLTTPIGAKEKFWGELKGEGTSDKGQETRDMGQRIRKEWLEARSKKQGLEEDDGRIEKMVDEEIALNQKGSLAQIQAREESRIAANIQGLASQKSLEQEVGAIIGKAPTPIPLSTPSAPRPAGIPRLANERPAPSTPLAPAPVRPYEPSAPKILSSPPAPATASPEPSAPPKPFSPPVPAGAPAPIRSPEPITPPKPPAPPTPPPPIPDYKQAGDPYRESVK